jgi:hypothetical protein
MVPRMFALVGAFVVLAASSAHAIDGVKGTVVRPRLVDAQVNGCRIAEPKAYAVHVGDVIELNYTYPIVPGTVPKKVEISVLEGAAISLSPLGIRRISTPGLVGGGAIGFYLDAKMKGTAKVEINIDGATYQYTFTAT